MLTATFTTEQQSQVTELVLSIQNEEFQSGLSLAEQPDLTNISLSYLKQGGMLRTAWDQQQLVGCIGLLPLQKGCATLKQFFVCPEYRSLGVGSALYQKLYAYAQGHGFHQIIPDTPETAVQAQRFYE